MKFRTIVGLPAPGVSLDVNSRVLLLGSCFATGIGARLTDALPCGAVEVNPFGVIYNPHTVIEALRLLTEGRFPTDEALFEGRDGLWHSWWHGGEFSAATREDCRRKVEERFGRAAALLDRADVVALTWGTAHVFELDGAGIVVGNCHKEPGHRFTERRMTVGEIADLAIPTLRRLRERRPSLSVVLTVSPYRYAKLGAHGSTLSKAVLHLAAERVAAELPFVHYFPAYEIVMDELRDYRFYDRDMMHPSAEATDYVWERFSEWTFTPRLADYAREKAALLGAERHRPLHAEGRAYEQFVARLAQMRRDFAEKWQAAEQENK